MNFFWSRLFPAFFLFFSFFVSCSNGAGIDLSSGSDETLKQLALKKEKSLIWTTEIEGMRLSKSVKTSSSVASTIKLTPEIIALSENLKPVYPVLEGFSSLDTSAISKELGDTIESIAKSVSQWTISSSFMADDSGFSLTLFKYDVETLWKDYNNEVFPAGEKIELFSTHLVGEPFIFDEVVQVPVRFENKKCHLDILFYINQQNGYKIEQIVIQNMEKKNG